MHLRSIYIFTGILIILSGIFIFSQNNLFKKNGLSEIDKYPRVTINSATFKVITATTSAARERGLSGRTSLPGDTGMLFIFDKPSRNKFWMKDMKFPLDIIFILKDEVTVVYENLPPIAPGDKNPPFYGGDVTSDRVLEINAGLAKKYRIKAGNKVIYKEPGV